MTAPPRRWEIPPRVWALLASIAGGVFVLAVVAGVTQWRNQQVTQHQLDDLRRDLCSLTTDLAGGPTPAAGPAGDRARALRPKMDALRQTTCGKREG